MFLRILGVILLSVTFAIGARKAGPNPLLKIVGGEYVYLGEKPYQISIQSKASSKHFCGGSIINANYVLTAAHCMRNVKKEKIKVTAGMVVYKTSRSTHDVVNITVHKKWDQNLFTDDIALLKVHPPFTFDANIGPAKLPEPHSPVPGEATVSGWGRVHDPRKEASLFLRKVTVPIISNDECARKYEKVSRAVIPATVLCTLYVGKERKGTCFGDSGGPLVAAGDVLIGLVSWSSKDPYCSPAEYPNVYTRVSEYIDWIQKNAV